MGMVSNKGVEYEDKNDHKTKAVKDAKGFNTVLIEKSDEWKAAMKKGKDVTLMIYACNVAASNYTDTHTGKDYPVKITFAEKISNQFSNVHVIGATGHVLYVLRPDGEGVIFDVKNKLLGNGRMAGIGSSAKK